MKKLYSENTANYPRLMTDKFFADYSNIYKYYGFMDELILFTENKQLLKPELWERFVRQFRENADNDGCWRGEYWGKMMRGASLVYLYTRDERLYKILTDTVADMINSADGNGRISTYDAEHEFHGWDMWCRKYVLLGMQYFLEICRDDSFSAQIVDSMCRQADYIIGKIGREEGKIPITSTSDFWRGMNSSSILEPIVRLYSITKKKKYLDFAEYIVELGGTDIENLFELAYKDELYPYQYPVTKAYEMISCFEGLLEYYRVTGTEKYKKTVINFADKILESDFTVIGCSGCSNEILDHSTVRQANTADKDPSQETCVTVTLMKFMYQMSLLTGDPKYVDAFEISLYNAYSGAENTEDVVEPMVIEEHSNWIAEPLPFDSYSPLTARKRGRAIGGLLSMSDHHYYGCCACISSAGAGLIPKVQLMTSKKGFVMNLFVGGTVISTAPDGKKVVFATKTAYPEDGNIAITVNTERSCEFELLIRNPGWSETTKIMLNGSEIKAEKGYISIKKVWNDKDVIDIMLDMRTEIIHPIPYGSQVLMNKRTLGYSYIVPAYDKEDLLAKKHIALRRGPIMLAQDEELGYSTDTPIDILVRNDGYADVIPADDAAIPYPHMVAAKVKLSGGKTILVSDYASAGKKWDENIAVWILTV